MARPATAKSGDVGFRCCAGARNDAEVVVVVDRRPKLVRVERPEKHLVQAVERALEEDEVEGAPKPAAFKLKNQWYWRPIGNEELVVMGGCAGGGPGRTCGVVVYRFDGGKASQLIWVDGGKYLPTVQTDADPRFLWVYGGDARSHFRRLLVYAWGRVRVDRIERNVQPRRRATKKKKR
jgi:hypothetical protein